MERERYEFPASFLTPDYTQLECDDPDNAFVRQRYDVLTDPVYADRNLNDSSTEWRIAKQLDRAERPSDLVRNILDREDIQGLKGEYEFVPLRDVAEITTAMMWEGNQNTINMPDPNIESSNSIYALYVKKLRELSANDVMTSREKTQLLEVDILQAKSLEDLSSIWLDYGGVQWEGKVYSVLYLEYLTHYLMRCPDKQSVWDNLPDVPGLHHLMGLLSRKTETE